MILDKIYFIYLHISGIPYLLIFLNLMSRLFPGKKCCSGLYYGMSTAFYIAFYFFPEYALGHAAIPYYYYFIVLMSTAGIWTLVFLNGSVIQKLIYYLYYFTIHKCILFFLSAFVYEYQYSIGHYQYILLDMCSFIPSFFLLLQFRKNCLKHPLHFIMDYLKKKEILLMMFCPASFFIILQLNDPSINFPHRYFVSISALLLLINLPIMYHLYSIIGENNESRIKLGKALAETSAQLTRYRYTILIEEQTRKEHHELKNNYFYIQTLLKENKTEQLRKFLEDHIGELSETNAGIHTNNVMIDHILNSKLALAQKHHIKTYTEILIPENIAINEEYFCTILLNLLDNAIEASLKEKDPDIQIYLNIRNEYLVFRVKNKVSYDVLKLNPDLRTSKENKSTHGLGMKIIRHAAAKSDAIFDAAMESNYFVTTVMFPLNTKSS